jgi:transketolase
MTAATKSSHIGSCFSVADLLSAIILKCESEGSVLFFSKGHAAAIYYAALSETGYFSENELESFGQNGSELIGHVNHKVPGVTFSTGSLGHGLPVSVGYAYGNPEKRVFVILSDGELNEGTTWESLALASHLVNQTQHEILVKIC